MVKIKQISKNVIGQYVSIAFKDDTELSKYHILGGETIEKCVVDTVYRILDVSTQYDLRFYKVMNNKQPIGFFVLGDKFLFSFGINVKFRNKEVLTEWFAIVKKLLHNSFFSVMNDKNTRAISFLEKQGMKIKNRDEQNKTVTLTI